MSYVDHIVPLCQLMGIPLLCTDPWIYELIQIFYPPMEVILDESPDFSLNRTLKHYDTLFYVDLHRNPHGGFQFVEYVYEGKARSVCGLHGNSDKKRNLFWAEKYADEDVVLLYGEHMVEFLKEKGIWGRFNRPILTGNFRWQFYQEHRNFFDRKMAPFLFPQQNRKTLLYATTWTAQNKKSDWRVDYSSFFDVYPFILENIPDTYQVIVKLHPHLVFLFPSEVEEIKEKYKGCDQILFLDDLPLIYPLLAKCDIYLGDYSSVGYDFLSFNRPMFFLNDTHRDQKKDKGVYLYRCGKALLPHEFKTLYEVVEQNPQSDLQAVRKQTYHFAFGLDKSLETLKQEIRSVLI